MRYDFSISPESGKDLTTAGTLSRAPISAATNIDEELNKEVNAFVDLIVKNLPATEQCLQDIQLQQDRDLTCSQVKYYCQKGWPSMASIKAPLKPYVPVKGELSVYKGLLLRGDRIVIPPSLRQEILEKLHSGHQGTTKCYERARQSVWWPGIRSDLEDVISVVSFSVLTIVNDKYQSQRNYQTVIRHVSEK